MLSVLAADRTRVAELEAQILVLERSLSVLHTEKLLAQERINSYKYPVVTLPNEIVSEIFIHFLPIYPLCPPLEGLFSPTTLTHICQRWREIAIANPMLWRAISFSSFSDNHTRYLQISQIWLDRSRDCSLSIIVDPYLDNGPETLAMLIPHRARWEHAELTLRPFELSPIRGPMPLLQYLTLSLAEIDGEDMIFLRHPSSTHRHSS
ncbi:F-box domain-containing protein [Mycena venus]|uniref:F-box domain-containing protein n=1 Tax=Mycena venus TaxID=2733690 RepID=A0A8H7CSY5_9AGAR|nr:F-box domain-containing protein [Mycena venus]